MRFVIFFSCIHGGVFFFLSFFSSLSVVVIVHVKFDFVCHCVIMLARSFPCP